MSTESGHNQETSREALATATPEEEAGTGLQYLLRTLHIMFVGLGVLIVVVVLWMLVSGMFYVEEDEKAMVFRFGELVSKEGKEVLTSEEGRLYWAWPYPVDEVVKIDAEKTQTIRTKNFWPKGGLEDGQQQRQPFRLEVEEDGYVLTGDANVVHMDWSLRYRVADVKKYYLRFVNERIENAAPTEGIYAPEKRGVSAVIDDALCNAVIKEVGRWPVEDVLVMGGGSEDQRQSLVAAVEQRVRQLIHDKDIGIEVQSVGLEQMQPPQAVHRAFRRVSDAGSMYQEKVEQAKQYKSETVSEAEAKRSEIIADARAYKTRTLESVRAESSYFQNIQRQYQERPDTTLIALYNDALSRVLQGSGSEFVIRELTGGEQEIRLKLAPSSAEKNGSEQQEKESEQN